MERKGRAMWAWEGLSSGGGAVVLTGSHGGEAAGRVCGLWKG